MSSPRTPTGDTIIALRVLMMASWPDLAGARRRPTAGAPRCAISNVRFKGAAIRSNTLGEGTSVRVPSNGQERGRVPTLPQIGTRTGWSG